MSEQQQKRILRVNWYPSSLVTPGWKFEEVNAPETVATKRLLAVEADPRDIEYPQLIALALCPQCIPTCIQERHDWKGGLIEGHRCAKSGQQSEA